MKHIPWQAIFFTLLFCGLLAWMLAKADAAPPPDADPALAPWFQSLQSPNGMVTCSYSARFRGACAGSLSDGSSRLYPALVKDPPHKAGFMPCQACAPCATEV